MKLIQLKRDNHSVKTMVAITAKFNYFQSEELASVVFNNAIKVTRFLRSGCPTFAANECDVMSYDFINLINVDVDVDESIWKNPFVSLFTPTFMV